MLDQRKKRHWEGDTLVVETANYRDRTPSTNFRGSTNGLKLIERFTPVGPDTLRYEFALDDPATWTRPWTAQTPLPRVAPPLYEFACHEQIYGVINLVMGAQVTEAEAAAKQGSLR